MLYIGNTPFAPIANERTFDLDIDEDGVVDSSGTHYLNLASLLTFRDNLRQSIIDYSTLAVTVPTISYDGDALPDLDGSTIQYAAMSASAMAGPALVSIEPMINSAFLSVPGGGVARMLEASSYFGPAIRAGLAEKGIEPGSSDYELFLLVWQTVIDSADPINWGAEATRHNNIVLHEVLDDFLVPNYVPTAPLSGTEPLIRAMGLKAYSSTQQSASGLDLVGRFPKPAHHWSFISPINPVFGTDATNVFMEMQRQFASFIASKGKAVVVTDASVMVPEAGAAMATPSAPNLSEGGKSKKARGSRTEAPSTLTEAVGKLGAVAKPAFRPSKSPKVGDKARDHGRLK
jgi:hypothetical protein